MTLKHKFSSFSKFISFVSQSTPLGSHYSRSILSIIQDIEHPKICSTFQSAEAEEQLIQSLQSKPKNDSARELEVLTIKLINC